MSKSKKPIQTPSATVDDAELSPSHPSSFFPSYIPKKTSSPNIFLPGPSHSPRSASISRFAGGKIHRIDARKQATSFSDNICRTLPVADLIRCQGLRSGPTQQATRSKVTPISSPQGSSRTSYQATTWFPCDLRHLGNPSVVLKSF
jgi:hypothetical protein